MAKKESILTDFRHWIGWTLTTVAIIILFHYLGVHGLHTPWYHTIYLFLLIIVIDYIKHKISLQ